MRAPCHIQGLDMRSVTDIQADLVDAYAARRKALDAEQYSIDTGQGKQAVQRNLESINRTILQLEAELRDAEDPAGGVVYLRGW